MTSYAMYIGRVGALAVALGVGVAVATGQGVASATEDSGTDSSAGSTDSAGSGSDSGAPASTGADTGATSSQSSNASGSTVASSSAEPSTAPTSSAASSPTEQTVSADDEVVVRSSGGALTSADPPSSTEQDEPPDLRPSPKLTTPLHDDPPPPAPTTQALRSFATAPMAKSPVVPSFTPQVTAIAPRTFAVSSAVSTNIAVTSLTADQHDPQPDSSARVSTFAALAPPPAPASVDPITAIQATIMSTIYQITALLSSWVAPAPGAPANPPLAWAVLEIVRREFYNQSPKITAHPEVTDALGNIKITLNREDADHDTLVYTATNGAKGDVTLNADGHSFTYTPHDGETGTDTITITASDATNDHIHGISGLVNLLSGGLFGDAGHTATATVTVKLNTPPTLTATAGTPDPSDGKVTVTLVSTDADGDTPTFSFNLDSVSTPTLTDPTTGTYTAVFTPSYDLRHIAAATPGEVTVTFTASVADGHGRSASAPVSVTISPANNDPDFVKVVSDTDADGTVTGTIVFTDKDTTDTLTYSGTGATTQGSYDIKPDGTFTYDPTDDARHAAAATSGEDFDTFTVTVKDGHGATVTKDIEVTVTPANKVPEFSEVTSDTDGDGKITGTIVFTDADTTDTLTYSGSGDTAKGSVIVTSTGGFTYTPTDDARFAVAAGDTDTDTFTVTVKDGHGATVTKDITVTITPADIATNPQVALTAAQDVIDKQVSASTAGKTRIASELQKAGVTATGTQLGALADTLIADASIYAAASSGVNSLLAEQASEAMKAKINEAAAGTLDNAKMAELLANIQSATAAINAARDNMKVGADTSLDAYASIKGKAADNGAPVLSRLSYTVDDDGNVNGTMVFIDPDGHPLVTANAGNNFPTPEQGAIAINPDGSFVFTLNPGSTLPTTQFFYVRVIDSGTGVSTYPKVNIDITAQTSFGSYEDLHEVVVETQKLLDDATALRQAAKQQLIDAMKDGVAQIAAAGLEGAVKPSISDAAAKSAASTMIGFGAIAGAGIASGTGSGLIQAANAQDAMVKELEAAADFQTAGLQEAQRDKLDDTVEAMKTAVTQIISSLQNIQAAATNASDLKATIKDLT